MAILKLRGREKQTVDRSDKGFLFELREIRVAYGEMCLAVIEMMWMTGGIEAGWYAYRTATGHSNDTARVADKVRCSKEWGTRYVAKSMEGQLEWAQTERRSEKERETETNRGERSSCYV